MRLIPDSGTRTLQGGAQWAACFHDGTVCFEGVVELETLPPDPPAPGDAADFKGGYAGLAFDRHCRLFHPRPEDAAFEVVYWGRTTDLGVHEGVPRPFEITGSEDVLASALPKRPLALACDDADFLYVADPDGRAVWLVGTWQQEVARCIPFAESPPLDVAGAGDEVFVLLADGTTWQVAPCEQKLRTDWPAVPGAARLAVRRDPGGELVAWVVVAAGTSAASLRSLDTGISIAVPFCTDLLLEPPAKSRDPCVPPASPVKPRVSCVLVAARRPGEEFLRFAVPGSQPLPGLVAPWYDGRGIERAPDGRVAYWTAQGLRHAAPARGRLAADGRVFGIALDSEHDQCRWGRLTVDACIPSGTRIRFRAFTRDDLDFTDPVGGPAPDGVPPRLSQHTWDASRSEPQSLFRDPSQPPLAPVPDDGFAAYDAPAVVAPGRYLWLVFELEGTRGKTPRLRSARVEFPGHAALGLLPKTLWRETEARDFLFRWLAPPMAMLGEWDAVGGERQRLLDARIAPLSALAWLAQFVGLVLDPCWSETVQRRMILEAAALFRTRGTLRSLERMLEILTDSEVVVIEQFRLRGGGVVGNPKSIASQAVLGAGYRVGGRIGEPGEAPLADSAGEDFDGFAHRFTVTVVAALDERRMACVRRLIEAHKPAHTAFTLCTAESGIRAGVGSHVGISSVIGRSGGFEPAIAGDAALGAGFVLGKPALDPEARP